jgi:hypothetical protein
LAGIETYWKGKAQTFDSSDGRSIPEFLRVEDKLRAIRKYSELSREERAKLNLSNDFDTYIEENFIDRSVNEKQGHISETPKYSERNQKNEAYIDQLIQTVIEKELQFWTGRTKENEQAKQKKILEIKEKVKNEIKAIELQSGLQAVKYMRPIVGAQNGALFDEAFIKKWVSSLPDELIENLTKFFVSNVRIADDFPIHFKYVEVEKVRTLPLYIKNEYENVGLLNQEVWNDPPRTGEINEGIDEFISALGGRYAYRVRVHFCLKFDSRHEQILEKYKDSLNKNFERELHFFEEVSGASSIICLIRKALNRALLWDVPTLRQYFPVAQEVYVAPEGKLYGNDTLATVWAASRVRLVELDDVKRLLNLGEVGHSADFDSYISGSDIMQGDYVCFDMVEAITISGFYARLKAVKQVGVDPKIYLEQLCDRIVAKKNLMKGMKRLWSYPFSLRVMESYLQKTVLAEYVEASNENAPLSNLAYEAQLYIIQGYLEEGLITVAGALLDKLRPHLKHLNNLLYANFYICEATCRLLLSTEQNRIDSLLDCESLLEKASQQLGERLVKFFRVGEFSQANLSPSFSHWARIYALRAKISVFFPLSIRQNVNDLILPISLLEKARISAARDGNSYYYAEVTLYQSWCYLMQAYIGRVNQGEFSFSNCMEWARRLIDHSLLCYSETSQKAYQDYLKDVVARSSELEVDRTRGFGGIIVPPPPLLHPVFNMSVNSADQRNREAGTSSDGSNMVIDIDSLLIKIPCKSTGKIVDLFGQHSAIYFFSYGMLKLCDDYPNASDGEILERVKEASKFFTCAWAIAEGGGSINEGKNILERNFNELSSDDYGVSRIRGLYLHRISEIVDLGKIFTIVCKRIISKFQSVPGESWEDITREVFAHDGGIPSRVKADQLGYARGQELYNPHLRRHFERVIQYLASCETQTFRTAEICRREVLVRTFRRLRGDE